MAYWLMKSEPDAWSWDQQVKAGAKGAEWTGVRNHTAKQNLMKMKKGDRAFFYHSNVGKEIVGIVEVVPRASSRSDRGKRRALGGGRRQGAGALPQPVTLDAIKKEPKLKDMALVKLSRLSVGPVTADEWKLICKMGGMK